MLRKFVIGSVLASCAAILGLAAGAQALEEVHFDTAIDAAVCSPSSGTGEWHYGGPGGGPVGFCGFLTANGGSFTVHRCSTDTLDLFVHLQSVNPDAPYGSGAGIGQDLTVTVSGPVSDIRVIPADVDRSKDNVQFPLRS